jgi:hypothetical protein
MVAVQAAARLWAVRGVSVVALPQWDALAFL